MGHYGVSWRTLRGEFTEGSQVPLPSGRETGTCAVAAAPEMPSVFALPCRLFFYTSGEEPPTSGQVRPVWVL